MQVAAPDPYSLFLADYGPLPQIAEKEHCSSRLRVAIVIALNHFAKKLLIYAVVLERAVCFGEEVSVYADVASRCGDSS